MEEQENWDEFPVFYLMPDGDQWDPQATHYADAECSMLDNSGELVGCERANQTIFDTADICEMQAEITTWDLFY